MQELLATLIRCKTVSRPLAVIALQIAFLGVAVAAVAQPGNSDSLTLPQVIHEVLSRNDRVAAARFMQESAERKASSTGTWDDPMLMLAVENLPTSLDFKMDDMTMRVTGLSQSIPYSGYKGLERKAARADAQVSTAQLHITTLDLVTAAKQAYFDLYYRQANLRDLQQQHELLEQVVASTTAKLRTNQAGQDEVLTAQADLWRLESSLLSLQQQVDAARYNLNSLRGLEPNASVLPLATPVLSTPPDSPASWIESAEKSYPELRQLDHQAESYRLSATAARRMQWPMLTLFGSYGYRDGLSTRLMADHEIQSRASG